MTCHRAINLARRHAETCNAVERCAPIVTAPYLQAAYDRMKLPISVEWHCDHDGTMFHIWSSERRGAKGYFDARFRYEPDAATRAYLALCESLTNSLPATATAVPPLTQEPGTAGVGSALTSAFSSRPAAVTPSDEPAATLGVANTPGDAERPISEAC